MEGVQKRVNKVNKNFFLFSKEFQKRNLRNFKSVQICNFLKIQDFSKSVQKVCFLQFLENPKMCKNVQK